MKRRIYSSSLDWVYDGPLYIGTESNNRFIENISNMKTHALTKSKALSNLRHRISEDRPEGAGLIILDPRCISSTGYPDDFSEDELKSYSVCPNCGERLTDGGYCPICDLGEEDI